MENTLPNSLTYVTWSMPWLCHNASPARWGGDRSWNIRRCGDPRRQVSHIACTALIASLTVNQGWGQSTGRLKLLFFFKLKRLPPCPPSSFWSWVARVVLAFSVPWFYFLRQLALLSPSLSYISKFLTHPQLLHFHSKSGSIIKNSTVFLKSPTCSSFVSLSESALANLLTWPK